MPIGTPDVIDLAVEEPVERAPSLEGPRTKLAWAESHLQLFQDEWQKVVDSHAYTFIHEVHADGLNHRYRAVGVPELDPKWTLLLGDCIHNLRSALDQLVYELVRANGGKPTLRTHFPAHAEPGGVRIPGGIAAEALRLVEAVQPYTNTDDGNRIRLIHRLDLIHQQRQLPLAPCASGRRITVNFRQQRIAPQVVKSWTTDRALETGNTVHGCEYVTPYYAEDPNLKVIPHIVIEDPAVTRVYGRTPAPEIVSERLLQWVRAVYLPALRAFFLAVRALFSRADGRQPVPLRDSPPPGERVDIRVLRDRACLPIPRVLGEESRNIDNRRVVDQPSHLGATARTNEQSSNAPRRQWLNARTPTPRTVLAVCAGNAG